jgi:hypothetical protein
MYLMCDYFFLSYIYSFLDSAVGMKWYLQYTVKLSWYMYEEMAELFVVLLLVAVILWLENSKGYCRSSEDVVLSC